MSLREMERISMLRGRVYPSGAWVALVNVILVLAWVVLMLGAVAYFTGFRL